MGGYFEVDLKNSRILELENIINDVSFWSNQDRKVIDELSDLKRTLSNYKNLENSLDLELLNYLEDEEVKSLLISEVYEIENKINELEIEILLNGEYDKGDAILEIHPGAGGTESCDWALMLYRMYTRWCEDKNYNYDILDYQKGDEAGIKSVSILVHGINCFGYLKNEKGVHRLVRISPFDSNSRRHTSFASVEVIPYIDSKTVVLDIKDVDLKIDVYRSSGAGGQSVNTTDSAVRITHLPTKTVVTCQNERSQIKNKEKAMEILLNKLYLLEEEKKQKELNDLKGVQTEINFGSQIRSYVMHPYSMVKDHRTGAETSNVLKVLDGDIDLFINKSLKG